MKKQIDAPKRQKKVFDDSESSLIILPSTWQKDAKNIERVNASCQTPDSLFQLQEREIQSGRYTKVIQLEVKEQDKGATLVDYIAEKRPEYKAEEWDTKIKDGCVTVDCEVNTDPVSTLDTDYFIEYVENKVNKSMQTESRLVTRELDQPLDDQRVASFLDRVFPLLKDALTANETSRALDILDYNTHSSLLDEQGDRILYWKQLSVDLEKKKILYPDWNRAKYVSGRIVHCAVTRNKERVYDIEYDDGALLYAVKEDYIRLLDDPNEASNRSNNNNNNNRSSLTTTTKRSTVASGTGMTTLVGVTLTARLQEGVRVHARVMQRNGHVKYLPGRIVKVGKNLYDVDCEGNRLETGLSVADLCLGLSEGHQVEARKPSKTWLHATGVSWNATGSGVAVSYGRLDITGWCEYPGALCLWNVFNSSSSSSSNSSSLRDTPPDVVLDHASCLMCVACHPLMPSVCVAGSFNGEVIIWDLTQSESSPLYTSPITDYAHKDTVVQVSWVCLSGAGSGGGDTATLSNWQVVSLGADGRVLFWSPLNKLRHPVKGFLVSRHPQRGPGGATQVAASSRRVYPVCHGVSAAAVSSVSSVSSSSSSATMMKPTWLVLGQEGGALLKVQFARLVSCGVAVTDETLRVLPPIEEVFPSLRTVSQSSGSGNGVASSFQVQGHVGCVTAIDWSPFHKNLFLTAGSDGVVKLFHTLQPLPLFKLEPAASVSYHSMDTNNNMDNNNNNFNFNMRKGNINNNNNNHNNKSGQDTGGATQQLGLVAVTAVKFSPIRPAVFAVSLSDGRVLLYDLYQSDLFQNTETHVNTNNNNNSSRGGGGHTTAVSPTQVLYVTSAMTPDDTATANSGATPSAGDTPKTNNNYNNNNSHSAAVYGVTGPVCVTGLAFNQKHRDVLCAVDWLGRVHLWRLSSRLCSRKRDELVRWEKIGRNQQHAAEEDEQEQEATKN